MKKLSHIDTAGKARMVDVSRKAVTKRTAVARGAITMKRTTLKLVRDNTVEKGDVLGSARIAGILAAKNTPRLIPLCHPLNISSVYIDFKVDPTKNRIIIESRVTITGQTGVEMEALTAVSVAALTIYDMCKSVDKEMVISDIMLVEKKGGRSGTFKRSRS
ncbi:MAG: cyclic pyranopterin monophosphate synthase MoaC [Nitrospiraceae bacterium]|jgi:cyclic pyranopterin phosphate synthase|nr:MAG: cyclic pyranopterin monophosphate synthase MoaC [Nitrospiraceae bacterium]